MNYQRVPAKNPLPFLHNLSSSILGALGGSNPNCQPAITLSMLNCTPPLIAAASFDWPSGLDWPVLVAYILLVVGLPLLGYIALALDIRAYLRSLRRALVLVSNYRPELPAWVRKDTPRCVLALGLTMPCTANDVLAAYRRKVKLLHPDRGGNRREFLRLQAHFEQAMALVDGE
jgi:hypothetical protein